MTSNKELCGIDAIEQARLVKSKYIKPEELIDAAIERIEKLNPILNAVVTPMFDQARAAMKEGLPDGPLRGVPFLLKDLIASCTGAPLSMGMKVLKNYVPDHDSAMVARYKKAGLVILGKTNTPELGILPTTEPELFGPCKNPWDIKRSSGGSSGGSAAAVASGMVPAAHASDGGGSIRIPSSCCGLFGLKPTRARTTVGPDFGELVNGLAIEHAVTRSVRDSALLLDITAGPDIGDPYRAPAQERPYSEEIMSDPGKQRLAFTAKRAGNIEIHDDAVRAVHETAKLCEDLGHHVEEKDPGINFDEIIHSFTVVWVSNIASTLKMLNLKKDQVEPLSWGLYEFAKKFDAADYILAVQALQRISRTFARLFLEYDVWLTPVMAEPPLALGSFDPLPDNPINGLIRAGKFIPAFTYLCNISGQPAMSVPLFWNGDNLPVGSHFAGRFGDEATLFKLAAQLERAFPWSNRKPAVYGG